MLYNDEDGDHDVGDNDHDLIVDHTMTILQLQFNHTMMKMVMVT